MQYMFVLFGHEKHSELSEEAAAQWMQFEAEAAAAATKVDGGALQPAATAKVVSNRDAKTLVVDGPFVDSKEQIGGFYVFECADQEAALALAAKVPTALIGHVEVRPMVDFDALPG